MTFARIADAIRRVRSAGIVGTVSAKTGVSLGLTLRKVQVDNSAIQARCLSAPVNTIAGSTGQMTTEMVTAGQGTSIRRGHILGVLGANGLILWYQGHRTGMYRQEQCTGTRQNENKSMARIDIDGLWFSSAAKRKYKRFP